ncbi:hypothetical protein [Rufibacter immobilis]|uniref:hypothetical protein n=1 Tax=Rufibacter immobilis TaxID=1348778 RepID=UPI0035F06B96
MAKESNLSPTLSACVAEEELTWRLSKNGRKMRAGRRSKCVFGLVFGNEGKKVIDKEFG